MRELVDIFLEEYAEKKKKSGAEDTRLLTRHILPEYGGLPVDEFTHDKIRALFDSLQDRPRELGKLRASLSCMFNVAAGNSRKLILAETWLPRGFANPVTAVRIEKHVATIHEPTTREVRSYSENLRGDLLRQDYADALLVQLLTASRIQEVTGMAWDEVDLENREWVLPEERSKNGQRHKVLLSDAVLEILKSRHDWKADADEFVFPAPSNRKRPLRSDLVQNTLAVNRKVLGLSAKFTSHNVRHAFTTWAAEQGSSVDVVNRCTNHIVATGINRHYKLARLNKPAQELWAAWAEYLQP